jgi:hypothetical protein
LGGSDKREGILFQPCHSGSERRHCWRREKAFGKIDALLRANRRPRTHKGAFRDGGGQRDVCKNDSFAGLARKKPYDPIGPYIGCTAVNDARFVHSR